MCPVKYSQPCNVDHLAVRRRPPNATFRGLPLWLELERRLPLEFGPLFLGFVQPHLCYLRVVSSATTLTLEPPAPARLHVAADVRVLIVAAVRLYRDGIAASLDRIERLLVVGTARSRFEALDLIARHSPDVLVLDAATDDSIDLVRTLHTTAPALKTLAFGVEGHEGEIIAFAQAGVAGYVASDASIDTLTSAIGDVMRGDLVCPPLVAATLLRHLGTTSAGAPPARPAFDLTARELEVVSLIDAGLSNKEIAGRLHIEVATVKNHVHHLLEKLQVTSRAEAAAVFKPRRTSR